MEDDEEDFPRGLLQVRHVEYVKAGGRLEVTLDCISSSSSKIWLLSAFLLTILVSLASCGVWGEERSDE